MPTSTSTLFAFVAVVDVAKELVEGRFKAQLYFGGKVDKSNAL
jgi:hypothetical protein